MIKIVIADEINRILRQKNSFLDRSDVLVFAVFSHDEALQVHRRERGDLIITRLDLGGMDGERFCSLVKHGGDVRSVPIILICDKDENAAELGSRCEADDVFPLPLKPGTLLARAKKLLNLTWRETYRVLLDVSFEGSARDERFACRSLNLSTTGMLMETDRSFAPGDRLVCSFYLPDSDTSHIETAAEIVRAVDRAPGTNANRYGIHFLGLNSGSRQTLRDFLESRPQ